MGKWRAIAVLGVAACGGGGGGGGGGGDAGGGGSDARGGAIDAPAGPPTVGYLDVISQNTSSTRATTGSAKFWASGTSLSAVDPYATIPLGTCKSSSGELQPSAGTPLDVGSPVTVSGTGGTLSLSEFSGTPGAYLGTNGSGLIGAQSYDVSIPGGGGVAAATFTNALVLPLIDISAPAGFMSSDTFTLTSGQTLDVAWTAANATGVIISFKPGPNFTYACRVADSGSFSVPANITAAVGPHGSMEVRQYMFSTAAFDGSTLLLLGEDAHTATY